ncbi:PQQ-dependent sugar dehydrogenase [Sodalinema gerasimenkoae]|uniref:PQQ-dependent sugar dehydrogenase n=1 Tax=Sodalinema gerasimenkoae TaxID=2862348 RepID=UPI00135BAD2D|nr:PQQ-dependent sugar dehydrogenase [Sodalinema gerasimenkoae]
MRLKIQPLTPVTGGLASSVLALLLISGCSTPTTVDSPGDTTADTTTDTADLVDPPNGDSPSPESAESLPLDRDWQQTTIIEDLEHPWGLAWLPDGTMLITERPGRLRLVRDGVLDPNPVSGVPDVLAINQGGLLDIAVHPRFEENALIYFTYSDGTPDANQVQVARGELQDNRLENVEVIFTATPPKPEGQHFGSRMAWLPDETLLVSIGDGGNAPLELDGELIRLQAQNRESHLGTIVRLNDDGSIPDDNPWVNDGESDPAIWSYGHRNIQGLALDSQTGEVWSTEHGARGGDELNRIKGGENYGWPLVTHSEEYTGGQISDRRTHPDKVDPHIVWTPAIAPSGLAVYHGDLFAGGLVSQAVHHIQLDDSGEVVDQRAIEIGQRVRDVREGPDGHLYVLTDESQAQLIRLD